MAPKNDFLQTWPTALHSKGDRKEEVSGEKTQRPIFESRECAHGKQNRNEMHALQLPIRFPVCKERVRELGVWFRGLLQYHISEVFDKLVELLKSERKGKDNEAGDFTFRKLNRNRREIDRALSHGSPYGPITKKWLLGLLNFHVGQSKG